jgi:hypothetical protein
MSKTLVDRSSDLTKLVNEGYDIEIRNENLLVHHVPYVTQTGAVQRCILVSELTTNGESTVAPGRHEVWVVGSVPHDHRGARVTIIADEDRVDYGDGLIASCRLSGKPGGHMPTDYYQKIHNYVRILGGYARAIDPSATHTDYPARESSESESVFRYHDSASSRGGLSAVTGKLRTGKVAIVGLGGTGAYILDLMAKTPVEELHLYDDDTLLAHNAFRAPGAAALDEIKVEPLKVEYYFTKYDAIRRGIVAHPTKITPENVAELQPMSFVFLAMDAGPTKRLIIDHLKEWVIPFVDCGIGLHRNENSLRGTVRTTTGLPGHYEHIDRRVSFRDITEDEYDWNLQTADLNVLNAVLAVIKWKKYLGYYVDRKGELNTTYTVASNLLISGDLLE